MTPTEKQKYIAEQAVYEDLHFVNPSGSVRKLDVVSSIVAYSDKGAKFIPIIRRMSDLTKEITHKGYNEDKPFIPLVELAKVSYCYPFNALNQMNGIVLCGNASTSIVTNFTIADIDELSQFDLLHLWHFDTRNLIEQGDAIDVNTLDVNPYSV